MTLKNFLRGLGRRWYVVLIGLTITGFACVYVSSAVLPTYQRAASLLLMPAASSVPDGGNPYLYLGGLGQASEVLVNSMASQTVREPLLDGHATADVSVAQNVTSGGPLLTVTVTGASDEEVAEVLDRALSGVESTLGALQTKAGVPGEDRITALSLTTDDTSTVIQQSRLEAVAVTAAAGVALTLLLTGFIDGLLLSSARRRRLRASERESDPDAGDELDAPVELPEDRSSAGRKRRPVFAGRRDTGDNIAADDLQDLDGFDASVTSPKLEARATEHVE